VPAQHAQVPAYVDDRYPEPPAQFAPDRYQQQQYGAVPGYTPEHYPDDADYPEHGASPAEDHAYYDDVPPRRRIGIMAVAGVFALVVLGTAGAFGYRAIFGSSGTKAPPPVIKADSSPSKIVPAADFKDPKSNKLIYDRVAERGQDEKLVSREEQPVDMNSRPQPQDQSAGSIQPAMGSGVVTTEPKKVHTIAIRPDGTEIASATPAVATPQPPPPLAAPAPQRPQAAEQQPPPQRQQAARPEPPAPQPQRAPAPAPSGNAPLSLSPDAQQQPASAPHRPVRTAAVAQPTQVASQARATQASAPSSGGGGYAVQVSSQRSEADAQAAFHNLQSKFPGQLGGKQPMIHRVDLGAKGIYFRAMVGPYGSSEEASQMCSSLKAAGGQCIVQKI